MKDTIFVRYCLIGKIKNQVKFRHISTEHIIQCNQSDPLADASGRIVDLMNENGTNGPVSHINVEQTYCKQCEQLGNSSIYACSKTSLNSYPQLFLLP